MDWKAHILIGIILTALMYLLWDMFITHENYQSIMFWVMGLPVLILGGFSALLPDFDHQNSKITQILVFLGILTILYLSFVSAKVTLDNLAMGLVSVCAKLILYSLAFIGLLTILRPKHRGITHTLSFSVVYGVAVLAASESLPLAIFGMVGYVSHLLADRCLKII